MFAIFKQKLLRNWLMILGWGIGLGLLGFYMFDIYENFFQQNVDLRQLFDAFPEGLMAFFGGDVNLFEPSGFLHLEFFSYTPLVLGIMATSSAAGLIAKKEEDGTLELILSQPISRTTVFWSRLFALILSIVLILVITWAGFALGLESTDTFDLAQEQLILPFASLFAVLMVFLGLALLLSMIIPNSGAANAIAAMLLIASYFISSLANIDDSLEGINRFSPLKYYQGGSAIEGLDVQNLLILLAIAVVFILVAWVIFIWRDLRFGGSGGFRIVFRSKE
jgi:ABC-2 type transport system permease protein